jgi:hypothetical protein
MPQQILNSLLLWNTVFTGSSTKHSLPTWRGKASSFVFFQQLRSAAEAVLTTLMADTDAGVRRD